MGKNTYEREKKPLIERFFLFTFYWEALCLTGTCFAVEFEILHLQGQF